MRAFTCTLVSLYAAAAVHAQTPEATKLGKTPDKNDRLRWELITDGASNVGNESPTDGTLPNLGGTDGNVLFHLDFQPLLDYTNTVARRSQHAHIEVGFTSAPRAVTARADVGTSPAAETLKAQGATVTGTPAAAPALSQQRAFTAGGEYNDNFLISAEGSGVFAEVGGVIRLNLDAFPANDRFFEKDGVTYFKVPSDLGSEGAYYRFEVGARVRLANGEMKFTTKQGGNVDDLLRFELVYRYSGASAGLVAGASTEHRMTWRFLATPRLHKAKDTELNKLKAVVGVEFDRDWNRKGPKNVRLFYGTNVNLEALFK